MKIRMLSVVPALVGAFTLAACGASSTDEDTGGNAADFYDGKTVKLIVGTEPGGGFDTYARVIAKHLGKHIPGEPKVIVENMPGAGHMLAMNHLYNQAPKDGTVIGNATGGLALQQVFGSDAVKFDMTKFAYLGLPDPIANTVLIVRSDAKVKSLEETLEPGSPELVIGVQSPGSLQTDPAVILKEVLGANIKLVSGYDGSSAIGLAMEQGEIDGFVTSWHTEYATSKDKFDSNKWTVLTQFNEEPDPTLEAVVPGVPTAYEFAKSEDDREAILYSAGPLRSLTRIFFLPPGVPEDRTDALRKAWDETMTDPDLLADAKSANLPFGGLTGEEVADGMDKLLKMPDDVVERLRPLIGGAV